MTILSSVLSSPAPAGVQALAAGAVLAEVRTGSRSARASILYSALIAGDTITVNGVLFTVVASGATGNQINVGGSLSLTLDAVVVALNASVNPLVAVATYSKVSTDTLLAVVDVQGLAGNSFTLTGSVGTPTATAGGAEDGVISTEAQTVLLDTSAGANMNFVLHEGREGQTKTLFFRTKGGSSNAVVSGVFAGGTVATLDASLEALHLKWIFGAWRIILNQGSVTIA